MVWLKEKGANEAELCNQTQEVGCWNLGLTRGFYVWEVTW